MNKGTIIFLNGVSSSGKTSLSKALINLYPNFFRLSIDDFDYIIEQMEDRDSDRLIPVPTEYFFHRTVKMFSDQHVNLIVDQILHNKETLVDYKKTLKNCPILLVGVHCSIKELERREIQRGDRHSGLALSQLDFVHNQQEQYDVEVDTSVDSIESCIKKIMDSLQTKFKDTCITLY